jgi:uncharacterized phage protein (TIGR02218 family)
MATPGVIEALLSREVLCLATLWKVERTDGVIFRFTDHDCNIVFEGDTYTPAGGFDASARQIQSALELENVDINGVISDDAITHADLKAGLYQDAKITETLIDWRYPWLGMIMLRTYWLVALTYTGEIWNAQLEGITRWLTPKIGRLYTRNCRFKAGDNDCKAVLSSESGTIYDVSSTGFNARRTFLVTGPTAADGFYDYGYMVIGSQTLEISSYLAVGDYKKIVLSIPSPIKLIVDTAFDIYEGCDGLYTTCKNKFNNVANYGGFPWIPGTDKILQTPTSGGGGGDYIQA